MLASGRSYYLIVTEIDTKGAWLDANGVRILLPRKELPVELSPGEKIEVFLLSDKNGKLLASRRKPLAEVGDFALLQVKSVGPHGAFFDWGLEKDLLAPFSEQPQKMLEGRRYLVRVCQDRSGRPIASGRLDRFLETENRDLREGDEVELIIWAFTDLGAKVIVNQHYEALLYRDEIPPGLKRGDHCRGYVKQIREDRRIDISLRRFGRDGVNDARATILAALEPNGFLPLHDQSPPEQIRSMLGLSKKMFKKALGGLYKDGLVELTHKGVKQVK